MLYLFCANFFQVELSVEHSWHTKAVGVCTWLKTMSFTAEFRPLRMLWCYIHSTASTNQKKWLSAMPCGNISEHSLIKVFCPFSWNPLCGVCVCVCGWMFSFDLHTSNFLKHISHQSLKGKTQQDQLCLTSKISLLYNSSVYVSVQSGDVLPSLTKWKVQSGVVNSLA